MKKVKVLGIVVALLTLTFYINSCKKAEESVVPKKQIAVNTENKLKAVSGDFTEEGIVKTIQTFQLTRKEFWETGKCPDYTQEQALFEMPMVLNFEQAGYGSFTEIEDKDTVIFIKNNGTSREGEVLLDGQDMFNQYRNIEEYVNTQLGDKKLYLADFNITETTEEYTVIKLRYTYGTFKSMPYYGPYMWLIKPIDVVPSCSLPSYVWAAAMAGFLTSRFYDVVPEVLRVRGDVLVITSTKSIEPNPNIPSTQFLYHTSHGSYISNGCPYLSSYYTWINNTRHQQLPQNAVSIDISYIDGYTPTSVYDIWYEYAKHHKITVKFGEWVGTPSLFDNNGPIIP